MRFVKVAALALTGLMLAGGNTMPVDGMITVRSDAGPKETMDRFEAEVRARGMSVFAHIDHAQGASAVGMHLRPTDLLIFGAAKTGTPLMEASQTIGIDLPLKALVWQDAAGATFLSYNDPAFIARRHELSDGSKPVIEGMASALKAIANKATTAPNGD